MSDFPKLDELQDRIMKLAKQHVVVGVPAATNITEKSGTNVATIAAVHEFGSPSKGIPERSFIRSTMKNNRTRYVQFQANSLKNVFDGKLSPSEALEKLGTRVASDVQKTIRDGDFIALNAKTIKRKKSDKPLIDTGNLRQSISFEVRDD